MFYKQLSPEQKMSLYRRDSFCCTYCGKLVQPGEKHGHDAASLDHVRSTTAGGHDKPDNLITACMKCNQRKGTMSLREWLGKLERIKGKDVAEMAKREVRNAVRRKPRDADGSVFSF